MKGKVKIVSVKNRSALITLEDGTEKWFTFGDKVKMDFVKKGDCEFEIDKEDEDSIPFIKCSPVKAAGKEFKPATYYAPEGSKSYVEWDKEKQKRISRSGLLNSAIAMFALNLGQSKDGIKELVTEQQIIETAKEFEKYLEEE